MCERRSCSSPIVTQIVLQPEVKRRTEAVPIIMAAVCKKKYIKLQKQVGAFGHEVARCRRRAMFMNIPCARWMILCEFTACASCAMTMQVD